MSTDDYLAYQVANSEGEGEGDCECPQCGDTVRVEIIGEIAEYASVDDFAAGDWTTIECCYECRNDIRPANKDIRAENARREAIADSLYGEKFAKYNGQCVAITEYDPWESVILHIAAVNGHYNVRETVRTYLLEKF